MEFDEIEFNQVSSDDDNLCEHNNNCYENTCDIYIEDEIDCLGDE